MADPYAVRPYGDPQLGKGFSNLASMFAPPSLQDQYNGTRAAEVRQKMEGIAELYRLSSDPEALKNPRFDLLGAITGAWNPTTGFGARDMKDKTDRYGIDVRSGDTRRGQDIESGDRRRGQDIHSGDFRYKTDQDNKIDIDKTKIVDQGNTTRTLLQPVQKDATRYIPPSVAEMFNLPPTQSGVVAAQPGEKNYMPDGRVLEGGVKPKTKSEVEGEIIAGLTDEEKRAIGFGNTPVETVVVDGKRTTMSRPQMLATGTPEAAKAPGQVYNWKTPDGAKGGTAVMREDGKLYDSQSGAELPAGVQIQGASAAQGKDGALGPTMANSTEANRKAAGLDAMQMLVNQYGELLKKNPGIVGPVGDIRGFAQNLQATLSEMTAALGDQAPNATITADQVRALANRIAPSRDPAIQNARIMAADLAYKWAQSQNPSGEVSRQAFERALETLSGGSLRNNISALEALDGVNQFITRERQNVTSLRAPTATPGVSPAPSGPTVIQTPKGNVTIQRVE